MKTKSFILYFQLIFYYFLNLFPKICSPFIFLLPRIISQPIKEFETKKKQKKKKQVCLLYLSFGKVFSVTRQILFIGGIFSGGFFLGGFIQNCYNTIFHTSRDIEIGRFEKCHILLSSSL